MFELDRDRYTAVLPLLADAGQVVVPFAVCEGYQPGRVLAMACSGTIAIGMKQATAPADAIQPMSPSVPGDDR